MKTIFLRLIVSFLFFTSVNLANAAGIVSEVSVSGDYDLTVDENSDRVYLLNDSDQVSVIDSVTDTLLSDILLNGSSGAKNTISVNPETGIVYTVKSTMSSFTMVDTPGLFVVDGNGNSDTGTFVELSGSTDDLGVDPNTNLFFASGVLLKDGQLRSIDGSSHSVKDVINVGNNEGDIAVDSKNKKVFYVDDNLDQVHVVEYGMSGSLSVADSVNIGENISRSPIAVNPETNRAYVGGNNGTVHVINTNMLSVIDTIDVPALASFISGENNFTSGLAVDPTRNKIYVALSDKTNDTVVAIDGATNNIDEQTDLGDFVFSSIEVHAGRNKVYILDSVNNKVTVIGGSNKVSDTGSSSSGGSSGDGDTTDDGTTTEEDEVTEEERQDAVDTLIDFVDEIISFNDELKQERIKRLKKGVKSLKRISKKIVKMADKVENNRGIFSKACAKLLRDYSGSLDKLASGIKKGDCSEATKGRIKNCLDGAVVDKLIKGVESIGKFYEERIKLNGERSEPRYCDILKPVKQTEVIGPGGIPINTGGSF